MAEDAKLTAPAAPTPGADVIDPAELAALPAEVRALFNLPSEQPDAPAKAPGAEVPAGETAAAEAAPETPAADPEPAPPADGLPVEWAAEVRAEALKRITDAKADGAKEATTKLTAAETKLAEAERQLTQLQTQLTQRTPVPVVNGVPVFLNPAERDAYVDRLMRGLQWCEANAGGVPASEDGKTREYTAEEVRGMKTDIQGQLMVGLRKADELLAQRGQWNEHTKTVYADIFEPTSELGKVYQESIAKIPGLKQFANAALIVGDAAMGQKLRALFPGKTAADMLKVIEAAAKTVVPPAAPAKPAAAAAKPVPKPPVKASPAPAPAPTSKGFDLNKFASLGGTADAFEQVLAA